MRHCTLVPVWPPPRQQVLNEPDGVNGPKAGQIDHVRTEAVVHEAVGKAQRVVDAARTEALLFGDIGFEVGQQFGAGGLCDGRNGRLGNADLDQVRAELASQAVKADRSCALRLCRPAQLFRKIGR